MENRSDALAVVLSYVEAAQQARRSQRESDWQRVSALLADEVLWQLAGDGTGELWRGWRGRASVLAALQESRNSWSRLQTKTVNAFADGDRVLVEQVSTVVGEDGTQHVKPVAFVFLAADGRVARISTYRYLLRDHDAKFSGAFDDVIRDEGAEILLTPVRAPRANAYAERWVRTVRAECLDWLLIVGRGHLEPVLRVYVGHYNQHRPHRALGLEAPDPPAGLTVIGEEQQGRVHRHDLLCGLLHEYRRAA